MGTPDDNKRLVMRHIEALNSDDGEAVRRLVHPDYFDHEPARGGAPERLEPFDIVAEDDRVVVRGRLAGSGGQQVHIWRLAEGRIVEHWCVGDRRKEESR